MIEFRVKGKFVKYDYLSDRVKKFILMDPFGDRHLLAVTRNHLKEADKLIEGETYICTGTQKLYTRQTSNGYTIHSNSMYVQKIEKTNNI